MTTTGANIPAEHEIVAINGGLIAGMLSCSDIDLALKNRDDAFRLIGKNNDLHENDKKELKTLLERLYDSALCHFEAGLAENPIYHHTQVLYNMSRLTLGKKCRFSYEELRNLLVLALLHDIGNAICKNPKVTNTKVKDAFTEADAKKCNKLFEEAIRLARKGREFRLEHMDKGPKLIRKVARECVKDGLLEEEDLHLVCRAVVIHDYPSIEQNLNILRERSVAKEAYIAPGTFNRLRNVVAKYRKGAFLLPFDDPAIGRLVAFLREADRLFMLSVQCIIKKDLKGKKIDADTVANRGRKNIDRHKEEYELYKEADKDDGKFRNESLYRSCIGGIIFGEARRKYGYEENTKA